MKTGLNFLAIACAATMAMPAMAEPLYLTYIVKNAGNGRASLVYPTLKECRSTTGQSCVKPKLVCNGYEFATVESSLQLMKEDATDQDGNIQVGVGKDFAEAKKAYDAAKETNFKTKLCKAK